MNERDQSKSNFQPIAVVGMANTFAMSRDNTQFSQMLVNALDGITRVPETHWTLEDYFHADPKARDKTYGKTGGFIPSRLFDPVKFGISPNLIESTDTSQLFGLLITYSALLDAGLDISSIKQKERTSTIVGVTGAQELVITLGARLHDPKWRKALQSQGLSADAIEQVVNNIKKQYPEWTEGSFPGLLGNVIAGRIASRFDFNGTNCAVDAACASSLSAMYLGVLELQAGLSDMVVTGGVDTFNDIFMYMCFSKTPALAKDGKPAPFSQGASGTALGEGAGIFILKRLEDAEKDNDRIYSVIKGVGSSSDGKGQAIYAPSDAGQIRALRRCYDIAGRNFSDVGLIEGHGTGTAVGDQIELKALMQFYKESLKGPSTDRVSADSEIQSDETEKIAIGSVKSQIGHTKAAAGAAGFAKLSLALYHKFLPPTLNTGGKKPLDELSDKKSPFYLLDKAMPWFDKKEKPRLAGVSAFGFGGTNFHFLLEEYGKEKPKVGPNEKSKIYNISGDSIESLGANLAQLHWLTGLAGDENSTYDPSHDYRLVLCFPVFQDIPLEKQTFEKVKAMLCEKLKYESGNLEFKLKQDKFVQEDIPVPEQLDQYPKAVNWYLGFCRNRSAQNTELPKIAYICPGQGSQYVDMGASQAVMNKPFFESLQYSLSCYNEIGCRLAGVIYPKTSDRTLEKSSFCNDLLKQTDRAQPSIGMVSLAFAKMLNSYGISPDAICGHSYGELTALHLAGVVSELDFYDLSLKRGQVMKECARSGPKSGMLAVFSSLDRIDPVLSEMGDSIALANHNSDEQNVYSGRLSELKKAREKLKSANIMSKLLNVDTAFHSPIMEKASENYSDIVASIDFMPAQAKVFSNTIGKAFPSEVSSLKRIFCSQIREPVLFKPMIDAMVESGIQIFVELGPLNSLNRLTKSIVGGKADVFSLDGKTPWQSEYNISNLLSFLIAKGYEPAMAAWYREFDSRVLNSRREELKEGFSVAINGKNKFEFEPMESSPIKKDSKLMRDKPSSREDLPASIKAEENFSKRDIASHLIEISRHIKDSHDRYLEKQQSIGNYLKSLVEQGYHVNGGSKIPTDFIKSPTPGTLGRNSISQSQIGESAVNPRSSELSGFEGQVTKNNDDQLLDSLSQINSSQPHLRPHNASQVPAQSASFSNVLGRITAIVSEKTGFPQKSLTPGMKLESDLGIDSIKRVEIFSEIAGHFEVEGEAESSEAESLKNKSDCTIDDIGNWISSELNHRDLSPLPKKQAIEKSIMENNTSIQSPLRDDKNDTSSVRPNGVAPHGSAVATDHYNAVQQKTYEVISELTGYPYEILKPEMSLESDLGVDSIKKVEIVSGIVQKFNLDAEPSEFGQVDTISSIISAIAGCASEVNGISEERSGQKTDTIDRAPNPVSSDAMADDEFEVLLRIISEKTGFPRDILNANQHLENDLGIDSIKKVEILSEVGQQLDINLQDGNDLNIQIDSISDIAELLRKKKLLN